MIKEIEKPKHEYFQRSMFKLWWVTYIEPINEAIRNGIEVSGCEDEGWYFSDVPSKHDTHKAFLIGITEIKRENEIMKEVLTYISNNEACLDELHYCWEAEKALSQIKEEK